MIRHLLKLAWRRRRANMLVAIEIVGCFLVVSVIGTIAMQFLSRSRLPLGFTWHDRWVVEISAPEADRNAWSRDHELALSLFLAEARSSEGVLDAAASTNTPYDNTERNWQFGPAQSLIDAEYNVVTDSFADVMGLAIVEGRWFGPEDEGSAIMPVVIDRDFARALVPEGSALGSVLPQQGDNPDMRVVGIVSEFRESGELSAPRPYFFIRRSLETTGQRIEQVVLRMRPGAELSLEPALTARLRSVAPQWQIEVRRMTDRRSSYLASRLTPLAVGGVVAAFLLAMVALGLIGVLWQNVTRRTQELALRRAVGSTASGIRLLVLGELLVVAAAAILAVSLLAIQIPALGLFPQIEGWSQALGLLVSAAFVLAVVALCGLLPGALAMRVAPAEALRAE